MAACRHAGVLSTFSPINHVQLACNEELVAFPSKEKTFTVCGYDTSNKKPTIFTGHEKTVSALCFGNRQELLLLGTGSEDSVIVWYLQKNYEFEDHCCSQLKSVVVAKDLGYVQHTTFNNSDDMISICVGNEVWLIIIETCKLHCVIEGHHGVVTASRFCPCQKDLLVTISEDRTFKVYDVNEKSALYHSPIISAHPFLSIAFHPSQREASIGSADGMVRIFSLEDRFKCVHTLDLNKFFRKYQQDEQKLDDDNMQDNEEPGLSVIGLIYSNIRTSDAMYDDVDYHVTSDLLQDTSILICGTTNAIFVVNISTCQLINIFDFRDPIPACSKDIGELGEFSLIPLSGSCVFSHREAESKIVCFFTSLFENTIHVVHVLLPPEDRTLAGNMEATECQSNETSSNLAVPSGATSEYPEISVLSKAPLCEKSPLKAEIIPKAREKGGIKKADKYGKKKNPSENQPVTFKTKIKSSGYTASPRTKMFSPKVNPPKQRKLHFSPKSSLPTKNVKSLAAEGAPREYNIPTELKDKLSLCSTPVAINQIVFSGDGKQLACALSNQTAQVLNIPQTSKRRTYTGHNGAVQSANFNHNGQLLLTSSKDNTARVWSCTNSEPVLTFTNQKQPVSPNVKDNPSFSKGINQAMFYYVDKFILLSSTNTLFLYKYHLDFSKDDLKRYQSKSHYKLVTSFPLPKAQNISHFACINEFYSYIVICAGSDNSLEIFDMNIGQSILTIPDVHTRNVHCIKLNKGSKNFSLPSQTYDLFLTAAISDGVKMWDLRTNRCVRKYEGHSNRSHPLGLAWSPCSKHFAVGSEDKSAYIFDVRQSKPFHRLTRHTDVVYDVDFHPSLSQLVTASLDGKLHFYSDKISTL